MKLMLSHLALVAGSAAFALPQEVAKTSLLPPRQSCENTPTSRSCWGQYNTDTNYYTTIPDTGKTVEVWLSAEEGTCNQDGYKRPCMTFNGTIPGPTIIADWGDDLVVHVTNNLQSNGTTIHWHGVRQLNSVEYDGVPGVTQCPISPGETFTYKFKVTQYGSSWYHSHASLQYSEGLFGSIIFNGPATSDYDEDLGVLVLQDWSHLTTFIDWSAKEVAGITKVMDNLLINGTNTFNCSAISDSNCVGGGKKYETVFQPGKKYLIRLLNVAIDSQFQFSIDGHRLKVIANDFVPIEPYDTDSVIVSVGQRYDVIVEANATPGDYWLRGGWVPATACQGVANDHPSDMTGIVRYDSASTSSPTSMSSVEVPKTCSEESLVGLVPYLKLDVNNIAGTTVEDVNYQITSASLFQWTINSSSLVVDWSNPTLRQVFNNVSVFPTPYNVVAVDKKSPTEDEWAVLVVENKAAAAFGGIAHPIHLHGHDFWILAQENTTWDGTTASFKMANPPRRDTAILPARGYLAIAFQLDNPGAWLIHCHIAWHASQGLALELIESEKSISVGSADKKVFDDTCASWSRWSPGAVWQQSDSGI
ncbi:extracellular dihydrogeodin oxidase [Coleophoma cylindrospora]|uniref:laccase n=1 Tax=Coleophoma cylindrospora TaxID=1849047 RepID=A0A3D8QQ32_9HELO|nr:extracellular dihydrogeodin oxidase [Coleophoma cylindrospora]